MSSQVTKYRFYAIGQERYHSGTEYLLLLNDCECYRLRIVSSLVIFSSFLFAWTLLFFLLLWLFLWRSSDIRRGAT